MKRVLATIVAVLLVAPSARAGDDYTDPEYAERDLKNMRESTGRNQEQFSDPTFFLRLNDETSRHYDEHLVAQANDPQHLALTPGLLFPGWYTADPVAWPVYREWLASGRAREVRFRMRTGAVVYGQLWGPAAPGRYPVISITPGSVQAPVTVYWRTAQFLANNDYLVLTFDAQGQGRAESFGHRDDESESLTFQGFPSQQGVNFLEATVDAVEFVLSTPSTRHRYAFSTDPEQGIDAFNPFWESIEYLPDDRANVGLAGHSFGAQGVTYAQDPTRNTLNAEHIRAIVAWDNLSASYAPTVPAMGQNGESFIEPSFNPRRPNPEAKKGAFNKWRAAGVDAMQIAPRAATHAEWSYIPYVAAASSWGLGITQYYSLAWFDRYLKRDPTADGRLLTKTYTSPANENCGGNEHCYSIYYKSAYAFRDLSDVLHTCDDIAHIANPARCADTDP